MITFGLVKLPAQDCGVKGFIYDTETRQPLKSVNVVAGTTGMGALTDQDGFYVIGKLPEGEMNLIITCIGYDTLVRKVKLEKDKTIVENMTLSPYTYDLNEVSISVKREKIELRKVSAISMNPEEIALTPSVGAMPDIIQHIESVPGVITRGDISGQVYVRGGTPVQTKMFLDEAVIYNPVHSIGLFSVFDNDYLRNMDFYTGGFDAEYGGCISSVIDINSKIPNTVRWSGKIDLSTIASKLFIEGPVVRDTTLQKMSLSVLLSAKSSHIDRSSEWLYSYLDQDLPYFFQDIYGKATMQMGKGSSLNISGFYFKDKVSESNTFKDFGWNSGGFSMNLMITPPSVPILIKTYLATSSYKVTLDEPNSDNRYSRIGSLSAGVKFYRYLNRQTVRYGLDFTDLKTEYYYFTTTYNGYEQAMNSNEFSGFADYTGNFGKWVIEGGLRGVFYSSLMKFAPEPRLSVKYLIKKNLGVKLATGYYTQNLIGAISDKDVVNFFQGYLSAPVDIVTENGQSQSDLYVQKAWHIIAGIDYDIREKVFLNLEAYYKNYSQLININKNKVFNKQEFPDAPDYMTKTFISENGFAEGIELSAGYGGKNLKIDLNYSFAITRRYYKEPTGEITAYYPQYDRRHNFNISAMYALGKNSSWILTSRWNYGSGFPFTPSAGYFEGISFDENGLSDYTTQNGQLNIIYGEYNSGRLPAYHRLDLSVKKTFHLRKHNVIEAEFSVINVYNRENIYYINRNTNEEALQLPILPSLRVSYAF